MRNLHTMLVIGTLTLATACSKSGAGGEDNSAAKQRAADFQTNVQAHKYKVAAFYSDKPIDYITSDTEVKSETDLWAYVKEHIKDDENYFGAGGALTIDQKITKMPGNETQTINGSYSISARGADVIVNFVDYAYKPLEYKLHEFDNAYFTVYIDGPNGSKLYSKYARVE